MIFKQRNPSTPGVDYIYLSLHMKITYFIQRKSVIHSLHYFVGYAVDVQRFIF